MQSSNRHWKSKDILTQSQLLVYGESSCKCLHKNGQPIKIEEIALAEVGPLFKRHEVFPARTNTEFVEVIDRGHVKMVVWERGAGPTLACETGACALVVPGVLEGRLNSKCQVGAPGGSLQIEWNEDNNRVYETGPAEYVFSGSFHI